MKRHTPLALTIMAASALLLALGVSATPTPAQADPLGVIDGETLDVKADSLNIDVAQGSATLKGNVRAVFGELVVECPEVEVRYDEAPKVRSVRGAGGVKASMKGIYAKARTVEVDVQKREVTLIGRVRLSRGKGWVEAKRAVIDLSTRRVSLKDVKGSIPVQRPR